VGTYKEVIPLYLSDLKAIFGQLRAYPYSLTPLNLGGTKKVNTTTRNEPGVQRQTARELERVTTRWHRSAATKAQDHDRGGKEKSMGVRKLYPDERRSAVLAALQPGANKKSVAEQFGISRSNLYQLLANAITDPKAKLREAEREEAFRRRVLELARWRRPPYT
jgi:transposase-like protein